MTGLQDVTQLMLAADPQHISADVYVMFSCHLSTVRITMKLKTLLDNCSIYVTSELLRNRIYEYVHISRPP